MFRLFLCLLFVGLLLIVFGWWGLSTKSGQTHFPEMAGMVPFYGICAGSVCLFLAFATYGFLRWRRRDREIR
jgi:hypothetical protein